MKGINNKSLKAILDKRLLNGCSVLAKDDVLGELISGHSELKSLADQINTPYSHQHERKIERIYSKAEIRNIVCENLIDEYKHDYIIKAVTDYLYALHVGE